MMANSARDLEFLLFPQLPFELRTLVWEACLPGPRIVDLRQRAVRETIGEWEARTGKAWPEMMGRLKEQEEQQALDNAARTQNFINSLDGQPVAIPQTEVDLNREGMRLEMGESIGAYGIDGYKEANLLGMYSDVSTPPMLYACREARDVFLQHYTVAFYCTGSIPQTYFNFSIDTLYLRHDNFTYYAGLRDFGRFGGMGFDLEYRSRIEDLDKIQKLAILLDESAAEPCEVELASILGICGGIKNFSVVLLHFDDKQIYGHFREHQQVPDEDDQLVMMGIEDMNDAPVHDRDTIINGELYAPTVDMIVFDLERLRGLQRDDTEEGEHPWDMPIISQKVMMPRRLRCKFEHHDD